MNEIIAKLKEIDMLVPPEHGDTFWGQVVANAEATLVSLYRGTLDEDTSTYRKELHSKVYSAAKSSQVS